MSPPPAVKKNDFSVFGAASSFTVMVAALAAPVAPATSQIASVASVKPIHLMRLNLNSPRTPNRSLAPMARC